MLGRGMMTMQLAVCLLLLLVTNIGTIVDAKAAANPYLCRCTCFVTNTTVVPLFSPKDPANPCTTCTRQFCLSQGLEACRGARIERPDADTGTGWEGEVWAKCLRPDSERDKTIITFYGLTVVALLVFAGIRHRFEGYFSSQSQGAHNPNSVLRGVMAQPWVQELRRRVR